MFFFKKKTAGRDTADTPLKRKAKAMPMTKKVQFCYIKPDEPFKRRYKLGADA